MAIDFPDSPSVNDTFEVNGRTYTWNGTQWKRVNAEVASVSPSLTVTGDFTVDTDTLAVDSGNNRVGINNATPTYTVDVSSADGAALRLSETSNDPATAVLAHTDGSYWALSTGGSNVSEVANGELSFYDGNASAYRMLIDENGNVGIGTTSPSHDLHVGGGNKALVDGVFSTTSASDHARLFLSDVNFGIGAGRFTNGVTDDDLYLWAYNGNGRGIKFMRTTAGDSDVNGGAWATSMEINNSGHVLQPYQPAFSVYRANGGDVSYSGNNSVDFDTKHYDVGNNFNLSTNVFTAPVSGKYFFSWSCYSNTAPTTAGRRTSIDVNGSYVEQIGQYASGVGITALLDLSANDTVGVGSVSTSFQVDFYAALGHNRFSGWLVS